MFDEIFDQLTIFDGMDTAQKELLRRYFQVCECQIGEVIFKQGESANFLYILCIGEVAIQFKPDDAPEILVTRIKEGGVFGWSAAFGSGFYTSGANCEQASTLIRVRGADLKKLRENHPETGILILKRLAAIVAERMQGSEAHAQMVAFLEHGLKNGVKPIGG